MARWENLEPMLCAVLGDQVKAAVSATLAAHAPRGGLPKVERATRLSDLDGKIDKLEKELANIEASANVAGIIIREH